MQITDVVSGQTVRSYLTIVKDVICASAHRCRVVISVRTQQKLLRREIMEERIFTAVRSSTAWNSKRTGTG